VFPRVRSWLSLGAPLELLSPLSVARVVAIVGLWAWPAAALSSSSIPAVAVAGLCLGSITSIMLLLRRRELGALGCHIVAGSTFVGVALLLWVVSNVAATTVAVGLVVVVSVFLGLFVPPRALVAHHVVAAAMLAGAAADLGAATMATTAVATLIAGLAVGLTVAIVTHTARRTSTVDPDTGLPNGYGLGDRLAPWLDEGPFVVATVLLRGLGEAREALGYTVGSELLRRVVDDLAQVLPAGTPIGRVEGDELVVALALFDHDGEDAITFGATTLANRLASAIGSGRYLIDGIEVTMRAHVGLAAAPTDGTDVTELVRRSSVTARRALESGRTHTRWDGTTGAMTPSDMALLADLRLAVERGELWLAYQPQVSPTNGRAVSVEALLRWTSPRHGFVAPGVFIPLAERTGLIDRLTEWVLDEALDAQVRWQSRNLRLPVSVNMSPLLLSDPELPERIMHELVRRGVQPDRLAIEVTETAAIDVVQAVDRLRPLHERGIRVSIDDFGTGYTSLSVLPHLPLDELKVDQRFVLASATSPADEAIVRSVFELAHRLGLEAVAEGVENEELSVRMRAIGFDLVQGYHYAKPMSETELLEYIDRQDQMLADRPPMSVIVTGEHRLVVDDQSSVA
jgi:predicted signal transduction protein with EAL and GGDEF domain